MPSPRRTSAIGSNRDGAVADYISALASASPRLFGICVVGARGKFFAMGDVEPAFSIQSVSKPFVFALVCDAIAHEAADIAWASTAQDSRSTR